LSAQQMVFGPIDVLHETLVVPSSVYSQLHSPPAGFVQEIPIVGPTGTPPSPLLLDPVQVVAQLFDTQAPSAAYAASVRPKMSPSVSSPHATLLPVAQPSRFERLP
jgi:hypothetical protein